ncbi:MAG: hypothetical protein WC208_16850 [Gallionella sp.]|jgi:alpha-tubulin suppressor-like RCC1 family protein
MNDLRSFLQPSHALRVSAGHSHTIIVKQSGELYQCDFIYHPSTAPLPQAQGQFLQYEIPSAIVSISSGSLCTACITVDGQVYTWGTGDYGRLGSGHEGDQITPGLVLLPEPIVHIACGGYHMIAISSSGKLYSWGANDEGQIRDDKLSYYTSPIHILPEVVVVDAWCGVDNTAILTVEGDLLVLGQKSAFKVDSSIGRIASMSYSEDSLAVITKEGALYMTGCNETGKLGTGDTQDSLGLTLIKTVTPVTSVMCQTYTTWIKGVNGKCYYSGWFGLVERGDIRRDTFTEVPYDNSVAEIASLTSGEYHTLISTKDGKLYGIGSNAYGQLGSLPVSVASFTEIEVP